MAAERPRRVPGFFATCWLFRSKIIFSWDFALAVAVGLVAYFLVSDENLPAVADNAAVAGFAVAAALVGVVVAALAVLVAFMDDEFLILMDEATARYGSIEGQLFPFWFVTGTGVGAILTATAISVAGDSLNLVVLRILAAVALGLVVWTAVGVFNLVAQLQATGVSRAIFVRSKGGRGGRQN